MINRKEEHRNTKMLSADKLVEAIEALEADGVISFDEFKALPRHEIFKKYFAMPSAMMMEKAIIKITDKRSGKEGYSTITTKQTIIENGEVVKTITRTQQF